LLKFVEVAASVEPVGLSYCSRSCAIGLGCRRVKYNGNPSYEGEDVEVARIS